MTSFLATMAAAGKTWLFGQMLPLWSTAGFDARAGQFVEALSPAGEPLSLPRRTLVQARQMFVFCAGGRLGWDGPWRDRASAAGELLLARGRSSAGDWIYSFDAEGQAADRRADLYTQAFVIFGLAEAGLTLGRTDFIAAARATCARLEASWADPSGGFFDGEIAPHPGRQNPHMHLLEAFLALHAATGDGADLTRAEQLAELFTTRLLTNAECIPEAFDAAWRPIASGGAAPGHQFEWAWLLDRLRRAGGGDRSVTAGALAAFGERCGVDAAGFAIDEIELDGSPKSAEARLWPQTERLKSALMRCDLDAGDADPAAPAAVRQAFDALGAYLDAPTPGSWRDARLAGGGWRESPAPASSAYHIVSALQTLIEAASGRA
ncbi:MAG TPA: AGE family epimerase/isomerase [Caulobacteraceae bacterium]|nr:AGE family epimerase/isomerase [Caulobacteraceae bacterium]